MQKLKSLFLTEVRSTPGVKFLFPLADAVEEVPNSISTEVIGGRNGVYIFPTGTTFPGLKYPLVDGIGGRVVTTEMTAESNKLGRVRREAVKAGMAHAWNGYKRYAWGRDELKPQVLSGSVFNPGSSQLHRVLSPAE